MGLDSLSKEEKIALYEAIQEKKRRIRDSRPQYQPNVGQLEIHECTKRERFVFSGNGAGKTTLVVQEAVHAARGYNPWLKKNTKIPANIVVVLDSPDKIEQKFIPELTKWFNADDITPRKKGKPYESILEFTNGSTIEFNFHEQSDFKTEGVDDLDLIIFDEPPPRKQYIGLSRGMRTKGSDPKILMVGTPISAPWLRTEIYERWVNGELPNVECFKFGTEVNRANLRDGYIEEFANKLSDHERAVRLEGAFFDSEGLALAHLFKRQTHIIEPFPWELTHPVVCSVDFHQSKPHTACLLGADREGNYYYIKEMQSKAPPIEFAELLKQFCKGYTVRDTVCDSLGNTPLTGGEGSMTFIQKMNNCGIRMRPTSFKDKNDEDFMQKIKQVLEIPLKEDNFGNKLPKLRIFRGNSGIISNIENVSWTKYRNEEEYKPKLDITQKDYLACLKYALASPQALRYTRAKTFKSGRSPWSGPK